MIIASALSAQTRQYLLIVLLNYLGVETLEYEQPSS